MAKVTNSFTTYDATSDREQLSNMIYLISPTQTPFFTSIKKNKTRNVIFDWQTQNLSTPTGVGQLEGFELSRSASPATVRESNVTMILKRDATVSNTQASSDPAGKGKGEMAWQMSVAAKDLKRDVETAICQNFAKNAGNATTVRATRSFEAWDVNASRGTGGAAGTTSSEATDGTQRALTEVLFMDVMTLCFQNGGEPSLAICGPVNKQKISDFTGRASAREVIGADEIQQSVAVYISDFGTVKIMASNFSRERSVLLVDPNMAAVTYLRDFQTQDIANIGDAKTKLLTVEMGLEISNAKAHGIVADLTIT